MSKVLNEMSTLCSNVSDLTSGIKDMLCEMDNGGSDNTTKSSCFTCGSPQHLAKEFRLDYEEVQRSGLFDSKTASQPKANMTKKWPDPLPS